jgi:isopentenyl-diphosphate delta-isomerase
MSASEIIDILDDEGRVVATITREEAERDNHTTQNVLVFVFNPKGHVWVQLRPKTKNHYPGLWDISACGGVVSGESHLESVRREVQEEMGILPKLHFVESFLNIFPGDNGEERRRLSHLYIGISDETPQPNEEVDEFRSWHPKKLRLDIVKQPAAYIPPFIMELDKALAAYERIVASTV